MMPGFSSGGAGTQALEHARPGLYQLSSKPDLGVPQKDAAINGTTAGTDPVTPAVLLELFPQGWDRGRRWLSDPHGGDSGAHWK